MNYRILISFPPLSSLSLSLFHQNWPFLSLTFNFSQFFYLSSSLPPSLFCISFSPYPLFLSLPPSPLFPSLPILYFLLSLSLSLSISLPFTLSHSLTLFLSLYFFLYPSFPLSPGGSHSQLQKIIESQIF